jgi:predicted ATPase
MIAAICRRLDGIEVAAARATACPIALWTGELTVAGDYIGTLLEHSRPHALAIWQAFGHSYQGALAVKRGDFAGGLRLLRAGFDELGEARHGLRGNLALALAQAGQVSEGLAAIQEGLAWTERAEERWAISELPRIKGELVLLQGAPGAAATAEDHFRQALDWARRQGVLSWELRAAISLARLLRDQSRSADAAALLQPVYTGLPRGSRRPTSERQKRYSTPSNNGCRGPAFVKGFGCRELVCGIKTKEVR